MRRFKKVCLSLLIPLLFCACGASKTEISKKKLTILSTTAQVADLAKAIAGERGEVLTLICGDMDPHSYEIVKGDREKFERADLIFYNGLGLEHGASLSSLLNSSPKALAVGESIAEAHPQLILGIDPHIWMDISLWEKGVGPMVEALSKIDPEGAPTYAENGKTFSEKMLKTHVAIQEKMGKIPSEKRYLVTSHDAFHYFGRAYLGGEERVSAPEGLAPEGQLSLSDIQKIIDFLKEKKISVLFPESNVNRDSLRKIASAGKELGLTVRICQSPLYGDAMSGLSYLEMMEKNGETIAREICD
jgi:manganese/zinc/iron transport system substrate-binding protein